MNDVNQPPSKQDADLQASRDLAREIALLAHDRHCTDVVIFELADRSPVAKHFVICTGTSEQQIRSIGRELQKIGRDKGYKVMGRDGLQQGRWVIVDFIDVVVHLFDEEFRRFYDLELLWGDAPKLNWQRDASS